MVSLGFKRFLDTCILRRHTKSYKCLSWYSIVPKYFDHHQVRVYVQFTETLVVYWVIWTGVQRSNIRRSLIHNRKPKTFFGVLFWMKKRSGFKHYERMKRFKWSDHCHDKGVLIWVSVKLRLLKKLKGYWFFIYNCKHDLTLFTYGTTRVGLGQVSFGDCLLRFGIF